MKLACCPAQLRWLLVPIFFAWLAAAPLATAQEPASPAVQAKIDQLIKLLDDPDVRAFLAARGQAAGQAPAPPQPAPATQPQSKTAPAAGRASEPEAEIIINDTEETIDLWAENVRAHIREVSEAIPYIPSETVDAVDNLGAEIEKRGIGMVLFALALPIVLGSGAEWLYRRYRAYRAPSTAGITDTGSTSPPDMAQRISASIVPPILFGIVLIFLFLVVSSRGLVATLIFRVLLAITAYRLIVAVAKLILKQEKEEEVELAPEDVALANAKESFWTKSVSLFAAVFLTGWVASVSLSALRADHGIGPVVAYFFGLGLWAITVWGIWQRPRGAREPGRGDIYDWLLTLWASVAWLIWVAGANIMFWLVLYIVLLPIALKKSTRFIRDAFAARRKESANNNILVEIMVDRGIRALIIALAVGWLMLMMKFHPNIVTADVLVSRVIRGALGGIIILLVADLVWQIVKAYINRRLELAQMAGGTDEEIARKGRLLTLLPTLRNFLAVLIAVIAVLMVLSGLGVQIGPLIAGAGIFGVAIGFGSQTLVKDVISGIFYMMDDAFRVGEYIQSGSYKGTVESFSIRSVKLRHHRGPVFTVPFGSLGAVQNMSRDWVIDKFTLQVSYDADLAKVKKLVKGVGAALLEDPEMGPQILETVKMKGVEQFGDYGITLSFAVMTKPGYQAKIRRTAYLMIRDAFAANGIDFASPTVQVAQEEHGGAAAARAANDLVAKKRLLAQPPPGEEQGEEEP